MEEPSGPSSVEGFIFGERRVSMAGFRGHRRPLYPFVNALVPHKNSPGIR